MAILFVLIVAAPGFYALAYLVQSTTRVISTLLWLAFWFWIGFVVPPGVGWENSPDLQK